MSFPNIPNITPLISVTTAQVAPLLLASIALEELSLAHIMNAEAEKIQLALGTLTGSRVTFSPTTVTLTNLLDLNKSVQRTLRDVIKKEMLLEFKFENILDLIPTIPSCPDFVTLPNGITVQFTGLTNGGLTWNYQITTPAPLVSPLTFGLVSPCAAIAFDSCNTTAGFCGQAFFNNLCGEPVFQEGIAFVIFGTSQTTLTVSFTLNQQFPIGAIESVIAISGIQNCFNICGPMCPSTGQLALTNIETEEYISIDDNIRIFSSKEQ